MEDNVRKAILQMMCYFQESVAALSVAYLEEAKRNNYVTPTSYLELLGAFRGLLDTKRSEISTAKSRYDVGLQKLNDTAESVAGMQEELVELQPKLVVAKKDAEELMVVIERDSKEASATRAIVEKESAAADIKANEAKQIKEECEAGLAEAIPALESAVKALSILKKDDITEVKMMKAPPAGVKLTMEAVCIMKEVAPAKVAAPDGKGKVDDYWEPAKKMMNDSKFLDSLVNYDKDNMKPAVIEKIKKYVANANLLLAACHLLLATYHSLLTTHYLLLTTGTLPTRTSSPRRSPRPPRPPTACAAGCAPWRSTTVSPSSSRPSARSSRGPRPSLPRSPRSWRARRRRSRRWRTSWPHCRRSSRRPPRRRMTSRRRYARHPP